MLLNYLLLILMVIIWSFSFIIVDITVEFIPPLSVALYRFIIASFTFLIIDLYLILKKKTSKRNSFMIKPENAKFSRNDWILIIFSSLSGVSLFFLTQYNAINLIGPSLPALFVCLLAPVLISILALIFFNEKLSRLKILGFLIATIGGFLLVTGGNIQNITPESPNFLGYLLALITPLLWAIYSTLTKRISKVNSSNKLNKYISYFGSIELLLFIIINNEFTIFIENFFNITLFLCAIYLGIGCYVIGYYIWQNSQNKLKSSKVASFLYIEPFLTLLFSIILKRTETIVFWNIMGGIIVLLAVLIINYE
ncbi:MAG: DMT family transporter [Candidatus Hodarchaeota archaeon]